MAVPSVSITAVAPTVAEGDTSPTIPLLNADARLFTLAEKFNLFHDAANNAWAATTKIGGNPAITSMAPVGSFTLGKQHLVMTGQSARTPTIWKNGALLAGGGGSSSVGTLGVSSSDAATFGATTLVPVAVTGKYSRAILWSFAPSASWIAASYAIQNKPLACIGRSQEVATGTFNRPPVAIPMSGIQPEQSNADYDVVQRAYDPENDTLTLSIPSQPSGGVSSVASGLLRFRPSGGSEGTTIGVPARVTDPSSRISETIVSVDVLAPLVVHPGSMILGAQTHFSQGLSKLAVFAQARAANLPIVFVRDEMFWRRVEQVPGVYNSSEYDEYYAAMRDQGYKLMLELFNVNPLYDGALFPSSDVAQNAFAGYAAYLVEKYGDGLIAVELWNEPNGSFSYGYTQAALAPIYTSLAQKVYTAVKAVRTDIPVLVGASVLFAVAWHQRLITAGILPYCDGFSFHPYVHPDQDDDAVPAQQLRAAIPPNKTLWATEWGVNRHQIETPLNYYRKLGSILSANGVIGSSNYILQDTPPGLATRGLLDVDGNLTDQGNVFIEMYNKMWRGGSASRGNGSLLVPNYVGTLGYQCAWIQTDPGRGTLNGQPLDTGITHIPALDIGPFVETTP